MSRDIESPYSMTAIARRLTLLRKGLELSQAEMAAYAGISGNAWSNYEKGIRRIDLDAAFRLENSLSVPQEWVYRGVTLRLPDDIKVALINAQRAAQRAKRA
jgi:transcriptional regulator with XRE-family HTH domain